MKLEDNSFFVSRLCEWWKNANSGYYDFRLISHYLHGAHMFAPLDRELSDDLMWLREFCFWLDNERKTGE